MGNSISGAQTIEAAEVARGLSDAPMAGRRTALLIRRGGPGADRPARRTLLRVTWDTASDTDQAFAALIGEDVESRRAYIEEHALEVRNLDI